MDMLLHLCQNDSGGNKPLSFHAWSGSLIANIFQAGLKEQITEAVVLSPGEATLFFERWSCQEGLPYTSARDIGFSWTGPINWARGATQVEETKNTVQEGHWAIVDAVMDIKNEGQEPGAPQGSRKTIRPWLAPIM